MTAPSFYDGVRFYTNTSGTGSPLTVGSAVPGFRTPAQAGIPDGTTCDFYTVDGSNWELGTFVTSNSGATVTRTVTASSNSNNPINLSGNSAIVSVVILSADLLNLGAPTLYAACGGL